MTTTYRVELIYDMKGNAARGMQDLARTAKSTTGIFSGMRGAVALALGAGTFAVGKKYLWDFNVQMDRLRIGMGTVIALNFHKPFAQGAKAAEQLVGHFQKYAAVSVGTTKDYVEMANGISGAVLGAGMGLRDLEEITKGAVVASSALGIRSDYLVQDIGTMLRGQVTARDRAAQQLLRGVGINDYREYNKDVRSGKVDAGKTTKKALTTSQIMDAGKAFGESTEGIMSTLQDNIEMTLGKVGLPLMKAMTAEVKGWNNWLTANPTKVAAFIDKVGSGLQSAFMSIKDIIISLWPLITDVFGVVRSVMGFVASHSDLLVTTVKALMVYKGMSMLTAGGAAVGGAFTAGRAAVNTAATAPLTGGVAGAMSKAGPLAAAFAGGFLLGDKIVKATGLAHGLGNVLRKLTGTFDANADRMEAAFQQLQATMGTMDEAVLAAAKRLANQGAAGSGTGAQLSGGLDYKANQLEVLKDFKAGRINIMQATGSKYYDPDLFPNQYGLNGAQARDGGSELDAKISELQTTVDKLSYTEDHAGPLVDNMLKTGAAKIGLMEDSEAYLKAQELLMQQMVRALNVAGPGGFATLPDMAAVATILQQVSGLSTSTGTGIGMDDKMAPRKANVNVTINKIEVASDDPDRFVLGAISSFEEIVRNPTQAASAVRGGF